jgi:hypothetical protein
MRLQDVVPATFYQDYATNRTYLGTDPTAHIIRMSKARYLIQAADSSYPNNLTGCALINVTVRRFASASQKGAVTIEGPDWVVSGCTFTQNHAIGMHLANADKAWIHHNVCTSNGQLGFGHNSSDTTVVEDNDFSWNNTDGYWAADWESGGSKITDSVGGIYRRNRVHHNNGVGAWWDINNKDWEIYQNDIWDNVADGSRYEISYTGHFYENWISGNGLYFQFQKRTPQSPYAMLAVAGLSVNSSPGCVVERNILGPDPLRLIDGIAVHTRGNQNGLSVQARVRTGTMKYGPWDLNNFRGVNNDITLTSYFLPDKGYTTGGQFGETTTGLRTVTQDINTYQAAAKAIVFDFNRYFIDVTTKKRFAYDQTYVDFATYQTRSAAVGNPWEANGSLHVAPRPGIRVISGNDDGHWTSNGTTVYSPIAKPTNRVGDSSAESYALGSWIRVTPRIPQGATIDTAVIEVLVGGQDGGIPGMVIRADLSGNSPQPTSRADVTGRPRASHVVAWNPTTWPAGTWIPSPSVVDIVQELVNRGDWTIDSAITFFLEPAAIGFTTQQQISFRSFDNAPGEAAGFLVTYH